MGPELGLSYGEAVALILVGNILLGVAAPFAGWLGDRWSAVGMMGLFFLGTGGGLVMTGLSEGPFMIGVSLAITGFFASIYHPVGMAWLVRNAVNRGAALGLNGMFGGFGPSAAALMSGALIDGFGWRAAFIVPGSVIIATGLLFYLMILRGVIIENKGDMRTDPPTTRSDTIRVVTVLALTMICNGLIYQATQAGLPKLFSIRVTDFAAHGAFAVSALVAIVYAVAGIMQVVAGWLADRYPLKTVYQLCFVVQALMLFPAAWLTGPYMVVVGILMVTANSGTLPAENCLVARYSPPNRRGLAYGLKFVIALGLSGFGVKLEGMIFDATGGFFWLFVLLSVLAATAAAITFFLPSEKAVS